MSSSLAFTPPRRRPAGLAALLLAACAPRSAAGFSSGAATVPAPHAAVGRVAAPAVMAGGGQELLDVSGLKASVEGTPILKGLDLKVKRGEVHAIMGPNGSGKSTLSKVLVGHPAYEVDSGDVVYNGNSEFMELEPEERAQQGVFLAFQYPVEIAGVSNSDFLRLAVNKRRVALGEEEYDPIEFFGVVRRLAASPRTSPHASPRASPPASPPAPPPPRTAPPHSPPQPTSRPPTPSLVPPRPRLFTPTLPTS